MSRLLVVNRHSTGQRVIPLCFTTRRRKKTEDKTNSTWHYILEYFIDYCTSVNYSIVLQSGVFVAAPQTTLFCAVGEHINHCVSNNGVLYDYVFHNVTCPTNICPSLPFSSISWFTGWLIAFEPNEERFSQVAAIGSICLPRVESGTILQFNFLL